MFILKSFICTFLIFSIFCFCPINGQSNVFEINDGESSIEPSDNASVLYKEVLLSWEDYSVLNVFQVQISENKDFDHLILDTIINKNFLVTNSLENHKEYFWRLRDASPECAPYSSSEYHFFKTTNIVIDDENGENPIKIFPTHVNGKEVIYFDNPEYLDFDIKITSLSSKSQYHHKCSSDRKGITTASWPRGDYQIILSSANNLTQTREIVLH